MTQDGWYDVDDDDVKASVYVEDGRILRAVKVDHNGELVPADPYVVHYVYGKYFDGHRSREGWDNATGIKYSSFRARWRKGNAKIT